MCLYIFGIWIYRSPPVFFTALVLGNKKYGSVARRAASPVVRPSESTGKDRQTAPPSVGFTQVNMTIKPRTESDFLLPFFPQAKPGQHTDPSIVLFL